MTQRETAFGVMVIVLLGGLVFTFAADRQLRTEQRTFSTANLDALLQRVDQAVDAIGKQLAEEGFEDDLNRLYAKLQAPPPPPPPAAAPAAESAPREAATAGAPEKETLRLTGVIWSEKTPLAVVNDQLVAVGDELVGRKVAAIEHEQVTLKAEDGTEKVLKLYPE